MCQHAVSRRDFFQRMALGSMAGASILDLAWRRAAWAQAMVPGAATDLFEIQKVADQAGIGNSRYNLPSEVIAHPHLKARDRWRQISTPGGPIDALLPPPVISDFEMGMGAVPGLGEHTDAVLAELGYETLEIAGLRADGVIG